MRLKAVLSNAARDLSSSSISPRRASPRYVQLIELLMQRLAAKEWKPGVALPGEHALALEYGVSHGTMRKAIDQMVNQNLLIRHQGKGTFVATHDGSRALSHFFHIVGNDGKRELPTCELIERETGHATDLEADKLQIRAGANVLRFLRVRSIANTPFIVERLVLPASRFPNLRSNPMTELPSLLYEYYSKRYGVIVVEAVEELRVVLADATDARLLNFPLHHPLLEINRIALDVGQKPVEWRVSHCETTHHHYLNRFG
jgi:GntR family transcriptional regulator